MPHQMDVDYTYGRLSIGGGGFNVGSDERYRRGVKYTRTDVGGAYKMECNLTALGNSCSIL